MSLEVINTIATTTTALVIAATAIAALIQLRHLRAANQIAALLAVQNELDSGDFREAEVTVREQLGSMLEDPDFCAFEIALSRRVFAGKMNENYLKVRSSANLLGNTFENIGSMVKNGILDKHLVMDIYSWIVASYWDRMAGLIAMGRASTGQISIYENFEYLAALSKRYLATNPVTYPRDLERLPLSVPSAAKQYLS
ncbi:MAG: DUF4760 domain-containing protein [Candidatus Eremiobacteraeota bacterium]|nr:DUF4760 domain-containing protein [Candidatus Eremiobacteraeota bacterium]MBV8364980.1 DUF4760 domain-containing protein [Candidatus Eremiobacteraeota bacterium]